MLNAVILAFAVQLPLLIVYIVGIILALVNRRRYPRAAIFLLVAVGLSLVIQLLSTLFYTFAPVYLMQAGMTVNTYSYYSYAVAVISNLGNAAAFGFLLAAIFAGRIPQIK